MNYKVFQEDKELAVQRCKIYPMPYNENRRMEYVMAAAGQELMIESKTEIQNVILRPLSAKIPFELRDGKIFLKPDRPLKLSVEINGSSENNLMVFADAPEAPIPETEHLIRLKADETHTGTIRVEQDHTVVYLEENAVLHGQIIAENCHHLTICGKGRICMERYAYEMRKNFARSLDIRGCTDVVVRDLIIDDSNDWSLRIMGCDRVEVKNVKIFGCRGNSDGIDVCGSRNVMVSDIFTRVWDDSFVVKALDTGDSENITFCNSVLWNDFARPIEVGVELRADRVKNITFCNIDILHSPTGYPLMGIHHGDRAEVSDIVFEDIRIEDAPGAQLFDIRIADSVWNRDTRMGRIHDITFSDIQYLGEGTDILLSDSRVEGFSEEHDIQNIRFHNISVRGKAIQNAEELGLEIYDYVKGVSVTSDEKLPEALTADCAITIKKPFTLGTDGKYSGSVCVTLQNPNRQPLAGTAILAIAPRNTETEHVFDYQINPGETAEYEFSMCLQPGKYVFYLKSRESGIRNTFCYTELAMSLQASGTYRFVNYYDMRCAAVGLAAQEKSLILTNLSDEYMCFTLYTAMPVPVEEGEVIFSVEETDFGEIYALLQKNGRLVPAPQLRCPAEITYVFRNEPKVKEIIKTPLKLKKGESIALPFSQLGIDADAEYFLMELAADARVCSGLRYPYTLFHSTMPEKTAHMFGKIQLS